MSSTVIRLSRADVDDFARASGDVNPLHVDENFARRTPYGGTIAHGVLVVLAAMAAVPADRLAAVGSLTARFSRPVRPGAVCRPKVRCAADGSVAVEVREGEITVLRVDMRPGPSFAGAAEPMDLVLPPVAEVPDVETMRVGDRQRGKYAVASLGALGDLARRMGAGALPPALLGALAWSSWYVGMRRPGRSALFAKVTVRVDPAPAEQTGPPEYSTVLTTLEPRTGTLVTEAVCTGSAAGVRISMQAFHRPPVTPPRSDLLPAGDRLTGARILVVGGSRGLGAAFTAAFAGQGATVWAAHRPAGSAAGLRAEFGERVHSLPMDAADEVGVRTAIGALAATGTLIDGVVLSAGPAVLSSSLHPDSVASMRSFIDTSVAMALNPLTAALPMLRPDGWLVVVSSSTVEDHPEEWPHYTMAKAAVEALAAHCAHRRGLRVLVARAPRMWTDMSNGPLGRVGATPTEQVASAVTAWVMAGGGSGSVSVLGSGELAAWPPTRIEGPR
ncbi:SDR family NAD(P)-dependent oxidoreductase [Micromonospora sp. DT233]|uniref:SDR family NAD(P)-dependent oxidoreductase n=1 Tax=Micromonospora sp. DT233 TaxID=3393432 RepID=UPI003CEA2D02